MLKKVLAALAAALMLYIGVSFVYPSVSRLRKQTPKKSAMMEYRERQYARQGRKIKLRQTWVPFGRISPYLVKAVSIAEDDKFWRHDGFDVEGMERALQKDIRQGRFKAGGSTISQQLAKNLFLSPSRNPVRKIKEAILTWRMEHALKKRRIFELYLNFAEWGDGIFGIEAAARHYYGVPASALGPEQAARLACVLPNPHKYSPVNPSRYVQNRSRIIYNIMVRRGIVIPEFEEVMHPEKEQQPGAFSNTSSAGEKPAFMGISSMNNLR